ncbi:28S ribosomal protein S7, mitochondrial [Dermatophagoides pteronyssinus]|uniref:28S ribosomal protein S7, mitochondrial n=1 Tax=Dermatophagoides pteronyssinus TaxID=6956 RepID=A0ABQ8J4J4_DERPT|nr:28S ribosomal protein S7, mitochondrial [Dermatophagoides pteronyssinus]
MVFVNVIRWANVARNLKTTTFSTAIKLRINRPLIPAAQMNLDDYQDIISEQNIPAIRPCYPCSSFYDETLSKFVNRGQRKGQRIMMRELLRETFMIIKQQEEVVCDPLVIFHQAIRNCMPLMITRPVKRGGATYQVPFPISEKESEELAMRWLFETVVERPRPRKQFFPEIMARELIDCYYNQGKVVKKKQDIHRQCENNKAYAHYRWG